MKIRWMSLVALTLIVACSSESKLGEACDESGKTEGECEAGGVCGKDGNGAITCLKVCTEQANCGAERECNGVEGTNVKGCRLKSTTSGADAGKK